METIIIGGRSMTVTAEKARTIRAKERALREKGRAISRDLYEARLMPSDGTAPIGHATVSSFQGRPQFDKPYGKAAIETSRISSLDNLFKAFCQAAFISR